MRGVIDIAWSETIGHDLFDSQKQQHMFFGIRL